MPSLSNIFRVGLVGVLAAAGACMPGCAESADAAADASATTTEQISLTDDRGLEVVLAEPAERVAVVSPAAADMLLALGVTPVLVPELQGPTPAGWSGIPTYTVSHAQGPGLESLVAATPDLVVTTSMYARFNDSIERATGAKVITLDVERVEDLTRHVRLLADATGKPSTDAVATYASVIDAARAARPDEPVRVLALFGGVSSSYVFRPNSYLGSIIETLGAEVVGTDDTPESAYAGLSPLSIERAVADNPDVILIVAHGDPTHHAEDLAKHPVWSTLDAVREGRVVPMSDRPLVMQPGTELEPTLAALRAVIDDTRGG